MQYKPNDYLVMDDITGQICYASETVINWKGERVHRDNLDIRNPQDMEIRIPREKNTVGNPRPFKYREKEEGEL